MIFTRYIGSAKDGFTPGKVYLAKPEMDDQTTVGFDFVETTNDDDKVVRVIPGKEQFEYLDEVYAVVVHPFDEFKPGDVVVVDDALGNGTVLLNVKGLGNRSLDDLQILDRTNVFPGVVLMDVASKMWKKVVKVDEALWVAVEGDDVLRSPEEFVFAVADGDILVEPLVVCVDDGGQPGLTKGGFYYLLGQPTQGMWLVKNDVGEKAEYLAERFRMGR